MRQPLVIGVAGGTGSGKSTVARRLASVPGFSTALLDMDAYYRDHAHLTAEGRRTLNWDHPDRLDIDLFLGHLEALRRNEEIEKPVYDFHTHTRSAATEKVRPADVIVADGILLFADERVRALCDIKVFVDADADLRLVRRIRRDMARRGRPLAEILEQYLSSVRPMHLQFVEPGKQYADHIILEGGHNVAAIERIVSDIRRRLGEVRA